MPDAYGAMDPGQDLTPLGGGMPSGMGNFSIIDDRTMQRDAMRRRLIAMALASQGRGGDTMLAHIGPAEAAGLKAAGGAGTINPETGLPEFFGTPHDPSGPGGAGGYGGGGFSAGDGGLGPSGAGSDADPNGGLRGPLGMGGLPVHTSAEGTAGMPTGTPGGLSTAGGVGSAYENAAAGYQNRGFVDRVLDFLDPFGFSNMKPVPGQAATYQGGTYHTGWNPGAAIGSLASMALGGVPGLLTGPALSRAFGGAYTAMGGRPISLGGTTTAPGFGGVTAPAGTGSVGPVQAGPAMAGGGMATPPAGSAANTGGGYAAGLTTMPSAAMAPAIEQANRDRIKRFQMARLGLALNPAFSA